MAVQPQTPYKEYTANGSTKSFALGFDCENQDHLIVRVDDIEPVVGTWSLSGGSVVFGTAPTTGKKITIQRNTPFRRDEDFQSYDNSFRPPGVNKGFDKIWLKLQELGVADWILSNRIDALKSYVDRKDDELKGYLLEEIRKQGVALDQLENYYNYLMQRLAEIAVHGGWLDSFVATWSGRTQEEKNRELISPEDFLAAGYKAYSYTSNYTNSNTNFLNLESVYTDRIIDLRGNYYIVDSIPKKNKYINGYFVVNKLPYKQGDLKFKSAWDAGCGDGFVYGTLNSRATSETRGFTILQSCVYSDKERAFYSIADNKSTNTVRLSKHLDNGFEFTEAAFTMAVECGHQSLGLYYSNNKSYLVLPPKNDGQTFLRCEAPTSGSSTINTEFFKVFSGEEVPSTSQTMVATSPFSTLIAVLGFSSDSPSKNIVKIFNASAFDTPKSDYSEDFIYRFEVPNFNASQAFEPIQSFAISDSTCHFLIGASTIAEYTIDGNFVRKYQHLVGKNMSALFGYYEPESLFWMNINGVPNLAMQVCVDYYVIGAKNAIFTSTPLNRGMSSKQKPKLLANGTNDIVANGTGLSIGYYSAGTSTEATQNISISPNTIELHGGTVGGAMLTLNTATSRNFSTISTSSVDGSTGGHVRFFDNTDTAIEATRGGVRFASGLKDSLNNEVGFQVSASFASLYPLADGATSIGRNGYKLKDIYAANGIIQTSDERMKQQFRNQTDSEKAAALEIKSSIFLFKFNDAVDLKGAGARWHVGVKAQQVISILESHGLNPSEYGFICLEEWDTQEEIFETWDAEYDEDDNLIREAGSQVTQEYRGAGSRYAIRYNELAMFIFAAI